MTNIILHKNVQNKPANQKMITSNLNEILRIKASIILLEYKVKKLNKVNPIDAFIQYAKIIEMKKRLVMIEILVILANKMMSE